MNRLLLAILALFAGFAAQVSPAQARVRGDTEIGATLAQKVTARAAAVAVAAAFQPERAWLPQALATCTETILQVAVVAPTVRMNVDRARE